MKRTLLSVILITTGLFLYAQVGPFKAVPAQVPQRGINEQIAVKSAPATGAVAERQSQTFYKDGRELTFVPSGIAGNTFTFAYAPRTYVWANEHINSVVFTHRMVVDPPGSYGTSRIAYDVSWDGGVDGSWTNNIHVYDPLGPGTTYPLAAGRYPQGAIYNPMGNTDPANAWYAYFTCALDESNGGSWGGYGYGVNSLMAVDPPAPTQTNVGSEGNAMRLIPEGFFITNDGQAWCIDGSFNGADQLYIGYIIWDQGTFNEDIGDFEYDEWVTEWQDDTYGWNYSKCAWSPDGQIGYFLVMGDGPDNPDWTNFHPVLFISEDAGQTWSEDPIHCQLGGDDGIESVKNFVSDEVMEAIYGAGYNREEIHYNMGFHADIAVDWKGNAHITGLVACANEEGWYPNYESSGTFHLWYNLQEDEWDGHFLYFNKTFDADLGGIPQYNRPQISSDMEGHYFFFSWIDTDLEGVTENTSPDIYCVGWDPVLDEYTNVYNVTSFTQAMWTAYLGSQSTYVFQEYINSNQQIEFTIPFVYAGLDPEDPAVETPFWYIDGFTITFPNHWIGVDETSADLIGNVSQNYPNPFNASTIINVELSGKADLSLEVLNITGKQVMVINKGTVAAGNHEFVISAEEFTPGVYFYTVYAGDYKVTRKMIVE